MGQSTSFAHRKQGLFSSENVDDINMAGRKWNMAPLWKKLIKLVDLGEPTSFLDHVYWVLIVNANGTKLLLTSTEKCSNREFLLEQLKNCQGGRDLTQKLSRGPTTWKVTRKSALKNVVSWQIKRQSSCTKPQLLAWTTIIARKRRTGNGSRNCPKYALRLSFESLYLARIGGPDVLWSVNNLTRAVTKWTRARDRRLARLIAHIHHRNDH